MNNAMARKLNLLIVDDDPSMVRLLSHMVERNLSDKMTVHGLSDSNEALRWLDQHCCDILISDINMPDTDGLEMLRFAKARNAWTQVIFVTGHSTWDRIAEAVEYGASDYLLKPVDQTDLITLLTQLYVRCARWQTAVLGTLQTAAAQ